MYVPAHFTPDDDAVRELLLRHGAADLITATERGLVATLVPFIHDPVAGTLRGHLARNNEQWRLPVVGEALVVVRGPDAYVSPSWYASKAEHGRVVPTWNYVTAHVHGTVEFRDDPAWVGGVVRELTDKHEAGRPNAWSVDDAPAGFVEGQLRAVVGVEVRISRVEAKFKLSQNRSAADVDGVVAGMTGAGDVVTATAVDRARR